MKIARASAVRAALVFALAAACALLAMGLSACGSQSAEDVIREGVTQELESIKNLDQAALDEMLAGAGDTASELEQYGISLEEFCRAWLDGFDYSVDSVTVDGESAVATVTISCRSLIGAMDAWLTDIMSDETLLSSDMTEEELNELIGSTLIEAIGSAEIETNTADLPYVLNGDTWEPGDGFDAALAQAFAGQAL